MNTGTVFYNYAPPPPTSLSPKIWLFMWRSQPRYGQTVVIRISKQSSLAYAGC